MDNDYFRDFLKTTKALEAHNVKVATAETLFKMKKGILRGTDKTDAAYLAGLIEKKEKNK